MVDLRTSHCEREEDRRDETALHASNVAVTPQLSRRRSPQLPWASQKIPLCSIFFRVSKTTQTFRVRARSERRGFINIPPPQPNYYYLQQQQHPAADQALQQKSSRFS